MAHQLPFGRAEGFEDGLEAGHGGGFFAAVRQFQDHIAL